MERGAATERQISGIGTYVRERAYLARDICMLDDAQFYRAAVEETGLSTDEVRGFLAFTAAVHEEIKAAWDDVSMSSYVMHAGITECLQRVHDLVEAHFDRRMEKIEKARAWDAVWFNEHHRRDIVERASAVEVMNVRPARQRKFGRDRSA